jgi:putative endonuclease
MWPFVSKKIGQQKEKLVASWLRQHNIVILEQNHHCKGGEIDLIGTSTQPNTVHFFEVKYRRSSDYGFAAEMLKPEQQNRIRRCAQRYLQAHPEYDEYFISFDLISWQADHPIDWIQNAF